MHNWFSRSFKFKYYDVILCPYRQGRFYIYYITQAKMENRKQREAIYLIFSFLWFDLAIYKIKCLLYLDKR